MKRLTTDNPKGCFEKLMNYAYTKHNRVHLSYADGKDDIDLCEYVSKLAKAKGFDFSPEFIMEDGLFDNYDDDFAVLYYLAVQAAELRERLKQYEDKLENGTLIDSDLPCNVGKTVYFINSEKSVIEAKIYIVQICDDNDNVFTAKGEAGRYTFCQSDIGKDVFINKEDAEARLKELKDEPNII